MNLSNAHNATRHAATLIGAADAVFVGAGAGMSADSGIAVYRGADGRYTSPKALAQASADAYHHDAAGAAEAYRTRYAEVLAATPHLGYDILEQWRRSKPYGAFVYTSNIDSMFSRAGFPDAAIYEVHGALRRSQCLFACNNPTPVFDTTPPDEGPATCPHCEGPARPNVMMFGDYQFHDGHRVTQWDAFAQWSDALPSGAQVVIVEIGAGVDVATVRGKCESLSTACGWPLVRINPVEHHLPVHCAPGSVAVTLGALEALARINEALCPSR